MSVPKPAVNEPQDGDHVAVLIGQFDPPTLDHERAVEALLKQDGIKYVWICPLASGSIKPVKDMCFGFCMEMMFNGKQASVCTTALDKGWSDSEKLLEWLRKRYPNLGLRPSYVLPNDRVIDAENAIAVVVGPSMGVPLGTTTVSLPAFVPVRKDVKEGIRAGQDLARSLPRSVWAYVQKNRLYR